MSSKYEYFYIIFFYFNNEKYFLRISDKVNKIKKKKEKTILEIFIFIIIDKFIIIDNLYLLL